MTGYASSDPVKNEKGVWYRIDIEGCPACMSSEVTRTRMPAPKPDDPYEIYHVEERWDYCQ